MGLKKCDLVTQSDPICNVYIPTCPTLGGARNCKWKKIGSTEVLWNTKTPSWTQRVRVSYNFAKHQLLRFSLVDVDNKKTKAGDDLGCCDVSLASIVRNGTTKQLLTNQKGKGGFGTLTIHAHDENAEGRVRVTLMLRGSHLDKKDLNGSSDPYYKLCSVIDGFGFTSTLYTSPTIPKTLNPAWQSHTFYVPTQGMPLDRVHLSCTVHDENKLKADKVIGEAWFTLKDLERLPTLPLIKQTKAGMRFKKSKNKNSGELIVQLGKVQKMPSFISFLHGGLRLNLIVAVDFTASNKSINDPLSLHNMSNPNRPSPYYQALHGIGSVLSAYVSDDSITGLGFGASLPGHGGETSFDFSLDGSHDGKVKGVQGLLQAYKTALRYVTFSGPTNFTTLIQNAMKVSMAMPVTQNNMHFSILLILTDGIITDMSSTVNAIIEASHIAPLEILIVGIGDANFEEMRRLDGDTEKLRNDSKTRQAKHDIVHFVKYDPKLPIEELASEVLKEIPQRVVEFMVDSDIQPIELSR